MNSNLMFSLRSAGLVPIVWGGHENLVLLRKKLRYEKQKKNKIVELYYEGISIAELSNKFDMPKKQSAIG